MRPNWLKLGGPAPPPAIHGVATVGNFDGVHRGHHWLLACLREEARRLGAQAVVVSLHPHPLAILRPQAAPAALQWPERRAELLLAAGADVVVFLHTTPELLNLAADEFFGRILHQTLHVRGMVEGANFGFGRGRQGDVALLERLCRRIGAAFAMVPLAADDERAVSSTRIREAIAAGDVSGARGLAGRPHRIQGTVEFGAQRGRTIGFPTANLSEITVLLPADGVYAVKAFLPDGPPYFGACNIGPNPTFGVDARKVEVHLLDFIGDLYGKKLSVDFLARLRPTRPFNGVAELKMQIARDVAETRRLAADELIEPLHVELARTIAEWVRHRVEPGLTPLGASLGRARFTAPGRLTLQWTLPDRLLFSAAMELVFNLEERLRTIFPEVESVESTTDDLLAAAPLKALAAKE